MALAPSFLRPFAAIGARLTGALNLSDSPKNKFPRGFLGRAALALLCLSALLAAEICSPAQAQTTQTISVTSTSPWQNNLDAVDLVAGETVTISAPSVINGQPNEVYIGDVSAGQPNISNYQPPAGDPNTATSAQQGCCYQFVAPGLVPWSLVGRIGDSGTPFQIGAGTSFVVGSSPTFPPGPLELSVNDNLFGDNSGSWTAYLQVISARLAIFAPPSQPEYNVTFDDTDSDLRSGTLWSVIFNGTTYSSNVTSPNTITVAAPSGGPYQFSAFVNGAQALSSCGVSGAVSVNEGPITQKIKFGSSPGLCARLYTQLQPLLNDQTATYSLGLENLNVPNLTVTSITFENCTFVSGFSPGSCPSNPNWISAQQSVPVPEAATTTITSSACPNPSMSCTVVPISIDTSLLSAGTYSLDVKVVASDGETLTLPTEIVPQPQTSQSLPQINVKASVVQESNGTDDFVLTLAPVTAGDPQFVMFNSPDICSLVNGVLQALSNAGFGLPSSSSNTPPPLTSSCASTTQPSSTNTGETAVTVTPADFVNTQAVQLFSALWSLPDDGYVGYVTEFGAVTGLELTSLKLATEFSDFSPDLPPLISKLLNEVVTNISKEEECYILGCPNADHYYPVYEPESTNAYDPVFVAGPGQAITVIVHGIAPPKALSSGPVALKIPAPSYAWIAGSDEIDSTDYTNSCSFSSGAAICANAASSRAPLQLTLSSSGGVGYAECLLSFLGLPCSVAYAPTISLQDPESPAIVFSGEGLEFSNSLFASWQPTMTTDVAISGDQTLSSYPFSVFIPSVYDQNDSSDFELELNGTPIPFSETAVAGGYLLSAAVSSGGTLELLATQQPPELAIGRSAGGLYIIGGGFAPSSAIDLTVAAGSTPFSLPQLHTDPYGDLYFTTSVPSSPSPYLTVSAFDALGNTAVATVNLATLGIFAGASGEADCYGESVLALAQQFGGLDTAAPALGYSSVQDLQNAIFAYCGN